MRPTTVVAVAALVTSALATPAGASAATCDLLHEHVEVPTRHDVTLPAARNDNVNVVLPDGYCASDAEYPVVLLLHGAGDTYETWVANTDVEDFAPAHGAVVVMPDGGKSGDPVSPAGWYSDWVDGSADWETFHTRDLVEFVEATYRTNDRWAVAGLSMGGFGALKYLGRHPGRFEAAASFSGGVDMMYGWPASGPFFAALHDQFGTPDDRVWGDQLTDHENWRAHNPTDLARNGAYVGKSLLLTTGTGTPGGHAGDDPSNPGGYGLEHFIWQMHGSFAANLALGGGEYNTEGGHPAAAPAPADWFYPGGLHSWPYWESAIHWALPALVDTLTEPTMGPDRRGRSNGPPKGEPRPPRRRP